MTGLLIRAHGGFFDVETEDGSILPCRARGRRHLDGLEPLPGDRVEWQEDAHHAGFGILVEIKPRQNAFIRPNLANLQQIIYVASVARPKTDPYLIDLMSVAAEVAQCRFLVCVNKTDLSPADELRTIYRNCRFPILEVSAVTGVGIPELRKELCGKISAFTGNSGVGKTSLLNLLIPELNRKVAEISEKHGRGRHTTRLTELFPLPESGYIADTPGFAALEFCQIASMPAQEIALCFPEFPVGQCRFPDCVHRAEPDCAVHHAVKEGTVSESRYRSYLRMLQENSGK